jgi:hypothetical protein
MLFKIITLPFWIISRLGGLLFGSVKLLLTFLAGIIKLVFNHLIGTIFGAIVGLLLGKEHVSIKLFPHRRRKHA